MRALITTNLRLEATPTLPEIRLYRAHPASGMGRFVGGSPPYWAHIWAGGVALARHILEHPEIVRRRRVLDLGTGSGVVAIAAARCGAASVTAVDVDPFAIAAAKLNADANDTCITLLGCDVLDRPATDADLVLVGDLFYEPALATRVVACLDRWGLEALVGDMGRAHLPRNRLTTLAHYDVPDFGRTAKVSAAVYRFQPMVP